VLGLHPLGGTAAVRMPPSHVQTGLKRFGQTLLIVLAPLAAASGYRAWVQVWSLDLAVHDSTIRPGSAITVSALTSGRVEVDLRLELWQNGRTELLAADPVRTRRNPAMDPRPRRGVLIVVVTDAMVRRWRPGPATLRATARGRPQFLREPPPEVREVPVSVDNR
jgi:hypothetical protein